MGSEKRWTGIHVLDECTKGRCYGYVQPEVIAEIKDNMKHMSSDEVADHVESGWEIFVATVIERSEPLEDSRTILFPAVVQMMLNTSISDITDWNKKNLVAILHRDEGAIHKVRFMTYEGTKWDTELDDFMEHVEPFIASLVRETPVTMVIHGLKSASVFKTSFGTVEMMQLARRAAPDQADEWKAVLDKLLSASAKKHHVLARDALDQVNGAVMLYLGSTGFFGTVDDWEGKALEVTMKKASRGKWQVTPVVLTAAAELPDEAR
jgi:hypothetical protein